MHQHQLGPFKVSTIGLGYMSMSMDYGKADVYKSAGTRASLDSIYRFGARLTYLIKINLV